MDLFKKNYNREAVDFANINLLGKCNADCYFCLGKDLGSLISNRQDTKVHFSQWENFDKFIDVLNKNQVKKVYVTGQNTDSLLYDHLEELVNYLHANNFQVGLRTNGLLALKNLDIINNCELSTGYSIHTLRNDKCKSIMGWNKTLDWDDILAKTERPRVAMVINRYNYEEFYDVVKYVSKHKHLRYFQARRISTDLRKELLEEDLLIYEKLYQEVNNKFPLVREFYGAPIYNIFGVECVFWRTVQTKVNSVNYFTDGTVSEEYFIIEGYLKNRKRD